jgi:hypothetical protein
LYEWSCRCIRASKAASIINGNELKRAHPLKEVAYIQRYGSLAQMTNSPPAVIRLISSIACTIEENLRFDDVLSNPDKKIMDPANHAHIIDSIGNPATEITK